MEGIFVPPKYFGGAVLLQLGAVRAGPIVKARFGPHRN
jgi:hypothetical protein